MERFIETPDGRTLAVQDAGDRGGRPVMVQVGTPGGGPGRAGAYPGADLVLLTDEAVSVQQALAWLVDRSS